MAPDAGAPVPFETLMEGAEPGPGEAPDLSAALRRIKEVARVLGSFATLRDPARPRASGPPLIALPYPGAGQLCRAARPGAAARRLCGPGALTQPPVPPSLPYHTLP